MLPHRAPIESERADSALWASLRSGDELAFEQLFRRYSKSLADFAFTTVGDRDAAEDIVHSLFVGLWHNRAELPVPRNVRAYLLTSIRNRSITYLRSEKTRVTALERLAVSRIEDHAAPAEDERAELVRAAIRRLPRRCREVVILVRFNHLSHAEAGGVLGIAPKTVEIHLARAIRLLREALLKKP
jgi:RNA polymerase sigma-70 factor (ECF subfamily)